MEGSLPCISYLHRNPQFGLEMVETCKLNWSSFFAPGAWWPKSAERRWPAGVYIMIRL